jgi:hypothetical protein
MLYAPNATRPARRRESPAACSGAARWAGTAALMLTPPAGAGAAAARSPAPPYVPSCPGAALTRLTHL